MLFEDQHPPKFLGLAVRNDRHKIGMSQRRLDEIARDSYRNFGLKHLRTHFAGLIERGIYRDVSIQERKLLAHCLGQPDDRYLKLETNPSLVIAGLMQRLKET